MRYLKGLGVQIFIAMCLGAILGVIFPGAASYFAPFGDIFIKLIKMLVLPLVVFSVVLGASSLSEIKSAGRVGGTTFIYYISTTMFAVMLGLFFGELFSPGQGLDPQKFIGMFKVDSAGQVAELSFSQIVVNIVPENFIQALLDGNILQVLFFSLFVGFGIANIEEKKREFLTQILNSGLDVLIWIIKIIMRMAPLGVFALMFSAVASFGYEILTIIMKLFLVYLLVTIIHTFIFYPSLLKIFTKVSIIDFLKKISKVQIVALSTSSSMATLPITMEVCEEELNVSKQTTSFVLPLGATINMDGNAIYYALVACFFAQMFGIDLGITEYIAIILTATIGSIGQAGVPGPSFLVVAVLLSAKIPIEGLPLLYAVDRIFDMIRTAVNVTGDSTGAIIVEKSYRG